MNSSLCGCIPPAFRLEIEVGGAIMRILRTFAALAVLILAAAPLWGDEPEALNPFDDKPAAPKGSILGCVELSDGSIHPGSVYSHAGQAIAACRRENPTATRGSLVGRQADRLRREKGVDGEGVAFQGDDEQRKDVHRPLLSLARIHAHDDVPERPQSRRRPVGHRLRAADGIFPGAKWRRADWLPNDTS